MVISMAGIFKPYLKKSALFIRLAPADDGGDDDDDDDPGGDGWREVPTGEKDGGTKGAKVPGGETGLRWTVCCGAVVTGGIGPGCWYPPFEGDSVVVAREA